MVRLITYSPIPLYFETLCCFIAKGSFFVLDNTHNEISLDSKCKYYDIKSMKTENIYSYKTYC